MKNVYIIGAFSTQFKKWPEKTFKELTKDAFLGVLKDAEMKDGSEIESVYFGNCVMHNWGQGMTRGQVCFIPIVREGLLPERVPIINVEGACATGSLALHGAWKDILSGLSNVSLAIGVEKMFIPDNQDLTFKQYSEAVDKFNMEETIAVYKQAGEKIGKDFLTGPDRTIAMDTYAMQAQYHMWKYGTTQRQIAISASKNHNFSALNPIAQYQFELTIEQVLEDRMVSYPFTRSMCAPIGDGAAAALVCSEEYLNNLPKAVKARAVKIKACVLTNGKYRDYDEPGLSKAAADKAYQMAGISPQDIDVAEVHDATSFCEIYQSEMMGFCPIGGGGKFIESGASMLGGKIPINTSGGLVSKGHPVGATGLSMNYELITQLRGEAEARQVKNAEFSLQENGGGIIGFEEMICSVIILQKHN